MRPISKRLRIIAATRNVAITQLLETLAGEPHTPRLRYFCSPQHTDSALYPITSQMERAAEFAHKDPAQVKLDKLNAF